MRFILAFLGCLILVSAPRMASAEIGLDGLETTPLFTDESRTLTPFERPSTRALRSASINPAASRPRTTTSTLPTTPPLAPVLTPGAQNALNYFGGQSARQTLRQMPRQRRFVPQGGETGRADARTKPYTGAAPEPTISPYLNLFRDETDQALPNYHTFVQPQKRQLEYNRMQQRQLQSLNRQVQRTAFQQPNTGAVPPTGLQSRFGDTGQYYSGWQR